MIYHGGNPLLAQFDWGVVFVMSWLHECSSCTTTYLLIISHASCPSTCMIDKSSVKRNLHSSKTIHGHCYWSGTMYMYIIWTLMHSKYFFDNYLKCRMTDWLEVWPTYRLVFNSLMVWLCFWIEIHIFDSSCIHKSCRYEYCIHFMNLIENYEYDYQLIIILLNPAHWSRENT